MQALRLFTSTHSGLFRDLTIDEKLAMYRADVVFIDSRLAKLKDAGATLPCCIYCGMNIDPDRRYSSCEVCLFGPTDEHNPATRESEGWTSAFAKLL